MEFCLMPHEPLESLQKVTLKEDLFISHVFKDETHLSMDEMALKYFLQTLECLFFLTDLLKSIYMLWGCTHGKIFMYLWAHIVMTHYLVEFKTFKSLYYDGRSSISLGFLLALKQINMY